MVDEWGIAVLGYFMTGPPATWATGQSESGPISTKATGSVARLRFCLYDLALLSSCSLRSWKQGNGGIRSASCSWKRARNSVTLIGFVLLKTYNTPAPPYRVLWITLLLFAGMALFRPLGPLSFCALMSQVYLCPKIETWSTAVCLHLNAYQAPDYRSFLSLSHPSWSPIEQPLPSSSLAFSLSF